MRLKALLLLLVLAGALAQDPVQDDPDSLRTEIAATSDLTEEVRTALLAQVDVLAADQRRAAERGAEAARLKQLAELAPDEIARIQAELDSPLELEPAPNPEGAGVAALEDFERQARAELLAARAKVEELTREVEQREVRRRDIPDLSARLRGEEQALLDAEPPPATGDLTSRVAAAARAARLAALQAERAALEAELRSYDARNELLPRRQMRWNRRVSVQQKHVEVWGARLALAREGEAEAARRRAAQLARAAAAQHPAVRAVIDETQALIARGRVVAPLAQEAIGRREAGLRAVNLLTQASQGLRRKLAVAGLSDAMGRLLRQQYQDLAPPRVLAAEGLRLRRSFAQAEFERLDLQERVNERDDVAEVAALIAAASGAPAAPDPEALRSVVEEAVTERGRQLAALKDKVEDWSRDLLAQVRSHQQLVELTEEHRRFVEENVLYVRSVEGGHLPRPADALAALRWLVVEPAWTADLGRALRGTADRPLESGALVIALLLLVGARRRLLRSVAACGEAARRYRTDRLSLTIESLVASLALAAPVPLALYILGYGLAAPAGQSPGAAALGAALRSTAGVITPLVLIEVLVRPGGVADLHLRWSSAACAAIRRQVRWFLPLITPLVVLTLAFQGVEHEAFDDSLGRPAAWGAMVAMAILLARVLHSEGAVLRDWVRRSEGLVARAHRLWFLAAVGIPLVLVLASLLGYHYTALQFVARYRRSLELVLGLVLARALLSRWQFIVRRRLAVEQALQRTRARAEAAASAASEEAPSPPLAPLDEEKVDIPAVDAQTRRLFDSLVALTLAVGLFFIWAGVLPALSVLDRVQVWPSMGLLEAADPFASERAEPAPTEPGAEGSGLPGPMSGMLGAGAQAPAAVPAVVSLADLLLAALLFGLTLLLTRNVPGLLEFGVLVRLPLDAGARYAVTTLVRYVILLIGLTSAMGAVSIGWSTVQWLAAALTFGLAFGLQEIFANFVSGVILLLERPIRVGDFVTVDGTEGQVTRLRMRATTITDWDNREMLVPNKNFITGSLINWTLTDSVTRIVVPVGIAYGSDVRKAEQVLLEVARATPNVLAKPAPSVVFRGFGDSSLTLNLRLYIPQREVWASVTDTVNLGIDDAFRAAGIEIAFPQHDLHLRTVDDGAARRLRGDQDERR